MYEWSNVMMNPKEGCNDSATRSHESQKILKLCGTETCRDILRPNSKTSRQGTSLLVEKPPKSATAQHFSTWV